MRLKSWVKITIKALIFLGQILILTKLYNNIEVNELYNTTYYNILFIMQVVILEIIKYWFASSK